MEKINKITSYVNSRFCTQIGINPNGTKHGEYIGEGYVFRPEEMKDLLLLICDVDLSNDKENLKSNLSQSNS